jgi:KUP system potassium uptake protein
MIVVSFKYLIFVLRADNKGEGGILALFALLPKSIRRARRGPRYVFYMLMLIGTALLFGDGVLTPAISVLSATEGLNSISPSLAHLSVPLTVAILIVLFGVQFKGSEAIGKIFGPIILIWFGSIGFLGFLQLQKYPKIVNALSPKYAIEYIGHHGFHTFIILSSVILAITGAEALYADLGHFGKRPIRLGWFLVVAPSLIFCYLGQASLEIQSTKNHENLFFNLAPNKAVGVFLVVMATLATVIASQALITGVASISRQAVQLGLFPRLKVVHTSGEHSGQIYVPAVNALVGVGSIFLVINFGSSAALANAYSFAIAGTMLITTLALGIVAIDNWKWDKAAVVLLIFTLGIVDLGFFLATVTKILKGAWVPLAIGLAVVYTMWVWRKGQSALSFLLQKDQRDWATLEKEVVDTGVETLHSTGVYLSSTANKVPQALTSQVKNLHSIPQKVVIVTVVTADTPYAHVAPRVTELTSRVTRVIIYVGFMENLNIPEVLISFVMSADEEAKCTYYLSDRKFISSPEGNLKGSTERFFTFLHRNSATASNYFGLPGDRVITLATQMDL